MSRPMWNSKSTGEARTDYYDRRNDRVIPALVAEGMALEKHLTEPELAAEYYRAKWSAELYKRTHHDRIERVFGECREAEVPKEWLAMVETVERFATTPHYDQEQS